MNLLEWSSVFLVCLLGAMTPGPSLLVVLNQAASSGRAAAVVTSISHALGIGIWAVITVFGLVYTLVEAPLVARTVSYLGAIYLIYLGLKTWRSNQGVTNASLESRVNSQGLLHAAQDGLVIALLNPKAGLFFLAFFSQFVEVGQTSNIHLILVAIAILVDAVWYIFVSISTTTPTVLAALKRHQIFLNRLMAIVLLVVASLVIIQSS